MCESHGVGRATHALNDKKVLRMGRVLGIGANKGKPALSSAKP